MEQEEDGQTRWIISGGDMIEIGANEPEPTEFIPAPWEL